MKIIYPYNEILPKKKAHDLFIFKESVSLSEMGHDVTLICGNDSLDDAKLFSHYNSSPPSTFSLKRFPLIRKNNFLNLSWNRPFFFFCDRFIEKQKPDIVILSVLKQAAYHLKRKKASTKYIYEVHELKYYPGVKYSLKEVQEERSILSKADLITVTTGALKEILENAPYNLKVPIEVVPLAVDVKRLPPPPKNKLLTLFYVGQLYQGQGIEFLLKTCAKLPIKLNIIGGNEQKIKDLSISLNCTNHIKLLGYRSPSQLEELVKEADAFVAPFEKVHRMPFVAHTKLYEYASWGRPFIAPDLPIVKEHFPEGHGVLFFECGNSDSLAAAITALSDEKTREKLQKEILDWQGSFSWKRRAEKYINIFRGL